jgi:hypothetical protein
MAPYMVQVMCPDLPGCSARRQQAREDRHGHTPSEKCKKFHVYGTCQSVYATRILILSDTRIRFGSPIGRRTECSQGLATRRA